MYCVYELQDSEWKKFSSHTQLIDAQVQMQRMIDSGILQENLKIISDGSDPNALVAPPEQPQ